jgi:hypothetical protein
MRFNQGAAWNALIRQYIAAVPPSDDGCAAEQIVSGTLPPWLDVSSAMIANVGEAARHVQSAARQPGSLEEASLMAQLLSYSSWRRHQMPVSLRPLGARSSHWYMPQRASTPRA